MLTYLPSGIYLPMNNITNTQSARASEGGASVRGLGPSRIVCITRHLHRAVTVSRHRATSLHRPCSRVPADAGHIAGSDCRVHYCEGASRRRRGISYRPLSENRPQPAVDRPTSTLHTGLIRLLSNCPTTADPLTGPTSSSLTSASLHQLLPRCVRCFYLGYTSRVYHYGYHLARDLVTLV